MPSGEVSTGQALRYVLKWDRSEGLSKITAPGTGLLLRTSEGLLKNTGAQSPPWTCGAGRSGAGPGTLDFLNQRTWFLHWSNTGMISWWAHSTRNCHWPGQTPACSGNQPLWPSAFTAGVTENRKLRWAVYLSCKYFKPFELARNKYISYLWIFVLFS